MSIMRRSGFTIVELLAIIVIIGILASITIVSYSGIQIRAAKAVLRSDLINSSTQLGKDKAVNAAYPLIVEAANNGKGLSKSLTTAYNYSVTDGEYCIEATSSNTSAGTYYVSSPSNTINAGTCPVTSVGR